MASTIKLKNGSGAPTTGDLVQGEPALDLTNKRLYTENASGVVIEVGTNPSTIDINAGTIDGTVIGGSSAAAGTFTTLTSSGDVNFDSNTLFVDASANAVGIGTAAPESIVHIKDTGNVSTTLQIESAASQYVPVINFDGIVGASADYLLGEINGSWDTHTNVVSAIRFESGADTTNKDDGLISFWVSSSGPTLTECMRIASSGFVGIGTTSPARKLQVNTGSEGYVARFQGATSAVDIFAGNTGTFTGGLITTATDIPLGFSTNAGTGSLIIATSGNVGIGLVPSYKLDVLNTTANVVLARFTTTATAAQSYGPAVVLTNDPNDTTRYFFAGTGGVTDRIKILSNGNIVNQNNSYTGISDEKLKENIVDAGSQWDDIKALRVRKYSFKEENASEPTQIGVIAQEVEAAGMSGLVYETADQDTAEDGSFVDTGEVTKTMKYSILYMKAVKALQEAMTRIETLEARITTLENA